MLAARPASGSGLWVVKTVYSIKTITLAKLMLTRNFNMPQHPRLCCTPGRCNDFAVLPYAMREPRAHFAHGYVLHWLRASLTRVPAQEHPLQLCSARTCADTHPQAAKTSDKIRVLSFHVSYRVDASGYRQPPLFFSRNYDHESRCPPRSAF